MAREVVERLVDDLDGSTAAATVRFGWAGRQYEIDLSADNAEIFFKGMEPYVKAARPATDTAATVTGEDIARALTLGIASGRYAPGTVFSNSALQAEHGASPGAVSKALSILRHSGHAELSGHRTVVREQGAGA